MCINGYWDITAGGTLGLDLHPFQAFQGVGGIFHSRCFMLQNPGLSWPDGPHDLLCMCMPAGLTTFFFLLRHLPLQEGR